MMGHVVEKDSQWHLMRLAFDGGALWTKDTGKAIGAAVRIRVLARDVSISTANHLEKSSIQNHFSGIIDAIQTEDHPALRLVRVLIGNCAIVARLTARSVAQLNIAPGQEVWIQVKSVALIE